MRIDTHARNEQEVKMSRIIGNCPRIKAIMVLFWDTRNYDGEYPVM